MSLKKAVPISKSVPKPSCSPRVEGEGKNMKVIFKSINDLNACIEDGTVTIDMECYRSKKTVKNPKKKNGEVDDSTHTVESVNTVLYGKYSDFQRASIFIVLKDDDNLSEEEDRFNNTTNLHYGLVNAPVGSVNSDKVRVEKDTKQEWHKFLNHCKPYLSEIREQLFPSHNENLHTPNFLKFKLPKPTISRKFQKVGDTCVKTEVVNQFDVSALIAQKGKIMVKVGNPWFMQQRSVEDVLMGVPFSLSRMKYLTDIERAEQSSNASEPKPVPQKPKSKKRSVDAAALDTEIDLTNRKVVVPIAMREDEICVDESEDEEDC
jgi:hypothetical protein